MNSLKCALGLSAVFRLKLFKIFNLPTMHYIFYVKFFFGGKVFFFGKLYFDGKLSLGGGKFFICGVLFGNTTSSTSHAIMAEDFRTGIIYLYIEFLVSRWSEIFG